MGIILETERLILRTWLLNDLRDFFEIYGDAEVWRFVDPQGVFKDQAAARRVLQKGIAYELEHGFCHWAAVEKSRGRVIGACGFNLFEGGPRLELVYHFARLFWRQGYATEAASACLRYAFERLEVPVVVASVDKKNDASRRVLEKIGFVRDESNSLDNANEDFYIASSIVKHKL
jgi:[ribosomal protein S5]-alanine N-acetyltransferase